MKAIAGQDHQDKGSRIFAIAYYLLISRVAVTDGNDIDDMFVVVDRVYHPVIPNSNAPETLLAS